MQQTKLSWLSPVVTLYFLFRLLPESPVLAAVYIILCISCKMQKTPKFVGQIILLLNLTFDVFCCLSDAGTAFCSEVGLNLRIEQRIESGRNVQPSNALCTVFNKSFEEVFRLLFCCPEI